MSQDVLDLLLQDHHEAEGLLKRFERTAEAQRGEYFCEVVQTLVGHEVTEELTVYPTLSTESSEADAVVEARLGEQQEAEASLSELERLDPQSAVFADQFLKLRDAVLAHAQAEESTVFPLLRRATTDREREELGERYEKAKQGAPTHPHPHAPDTAPANKLAVPVAALFDRARDAVHRS